MRSASQGTDLELVSFTRALHVQDQHKTSTVPVNVHVDVHVNTIQSLCSSLSLMLAHS